MGDKKIKLSFYGAAGTVTGSKHLLEYEGEKILLDCGLFQGVKNLRIRNWEKPPFDPKTLDAVVLSHAHIDHSGYLPALIRYGFKNKIYCTLGTKELLRILLPDCARLQREDADYANKKGFSRHHPAKPLFSLDDVQEVLARIHAFSFGELQQITSRFAVRYRRAGHILGSSIVELQIGESNPKKFIFSGDLGRWDQPIIKDPEYVESADYLMIESTYGDRLHDPHTMQRFKEIVIENYHKGGVLLIPAFAVGRTQELIWHICQMESAAEIPIVPVYLDSPMAVEVTRVYRDMISEHDIDMKNLLKTESFGIQTLKFHLIDSPKQSKALNRLEGPIIIISSSGMLTGGRILHHLQHRIENSNNTILLAGFQAEGTRGRALQDGAKHLRFYGKDLPVKAKVEFLGGMSAHADQSEILKWLTGFKNAPKHTYIVHGDPHSAQALCEKIASDFNWQSSVAKDGETIELS